MIRSLVKCGVCAIGILLFACGDSIRDGSVDSIVKTNTEDSIVKNDTLAITPDVHFADDSFLLDSFKVLIDSFCTAFAKGIVHSNVRIDTISNVDVIHARQGYLLRKTSGASIYWYVFDMGDANSSMNFSICEARYPDSDDARAEWKNVIAMSGPPDKETNDQQPCISYGNDYLFNTNKKLFWLTTACSWSYSNHKIIAGLLRRTVVNCETDKEVKCSCGGSSPRND